MREGWHAAGRNSIHPLRVANPMSSPTAGLVHSQKLPRGRRETNAATFSLEIEIHSWVNSR